MRTYKRIKIEGGCYFFTVVLARRRKNNLLVQNIDTLRESFKQIQRDHPFTMDAVVILPNHLHCIWQLPVKDDNFSSRWRLIKSHFSKSITISEYISKSRQRKSERGIYRAEVIFQPSRTLQLSSDTPLPVTLDGELTDLTTPLTVKVLPNALSILGGMPRG